MLGLKLNHVSKRGHWLKPCSAANRKRTLSGAYYTNFSCVVIFPIFHHWQNTDPILNITIFGRCRYSSAAVTSVKYDRIQSNQNPFSWNHILNREINEEIISNVLVLLRRHTSPSQCPSMHEWPPCPALSVTLVQTLGHIKPQCLLWPGFADTSSLKHSTAHISSPRSALHRSRTHAPHKQSPQNSNPTTGSPGARPTKHSSIEFEIRWKFRML